MTGNQSKVVMFESDEAATFKENVSGWVSRGGFFFGPNEHQARYAGCTHKTCECGNAVGKYWAKCDECRARVDLEKYTALPVKKWSGEPLVVFGDDRYLFDEDEVSDYIDECGDNEPMLVICVPVIAPYIEDYGHDDLPDDLTIDDACPKLAEMIASINSYIQEHKPILSWTGGRERPDLSDLIRSRRQ